MTDADRQRNAAWASQYDDALIAILHKNSVHLHRYERASFEQDTREATDRVAVTDKGTIAERVRRETCGFRDITLRYRIRRNDQPERGLEADKIMAGHARAYLYAWARQHGGLDYMLLDLDRVRAHRLIEQAIEQGREIWNRNTPESFTWITFRELVGADSILDVDLDLPPRLRMQTPGWYARLCETMNYAVWRGHVTDREATIHLAVTHAAATMLPWPEGWASSGRIRSL